MILNIHHSTIYHYTSPVQLSIQILRLTPFNHNRQQIINWKLETPKTPTQQVDWFGNTSHCLSLSDVHNRIEIVALGQVEVFPAISNPDPGPLPVLYYLRHTSLTDITPAMQNLALSINLNLHSSTPEQILQALTRLSALILTHVPYSRGVTHSYTTASMAFQLAGGVCQDHAHFCVACCRYLNLPARYVSGYLHTDDASHLASHAWAEVWVNQAWHSFDISNQCSADEHHIELAYGLDYLDASPVRGSRIGGGHERLAVISLVTAQ